ncbi:beta-ketoacyl-ACP synthase III [Nigerium sp.]|uniref:beta-ketoacyl-ACP synthase III n=1 Tax=Nigerium sp. TaxID=2042655 RepID=UPI003221F623
MTDIKASTGSPFARIYGIGAYVPSRVVDNAEMCTYIDSSDEWIQQRTGIAERRWIGEGETVEQMAVDAAKQAIEQAGIKPEQVDAVICSTVSHFLQTPSLATSVATKIGANGAAAFDISAACAGFCYGIAQGEALVRAGSAHYVVAIGVEALSLITDIHDRSTAFLFADGAGAAVIGPSDTTGISPVVWGSDGSQAEVITMTRDWPQAVEEGKPSQVYMEGAAVFRWATGFIADASKRVLDEAGLAPEELDVFVPHQANNRITDSMLRHLKLPKHIKVARTIKTHGNNSAASIPTAIVGMYESGEAKSGDLALIIGFGAGLVYAGQIIRLP